MLLLALFVWKEALSFEAMPRLTILPLSMVLRHFSAVRPTRFVLLAGLLVLWHNTISAQSMIDHWVFSSYGKHVQFFSGVPEYMGDVDLRSEEGTTSISDPSGNLLAYGFEGSIYNAQHDVMQNGTYSLECPNADSATSTVTQSALFLPKGNGQALDRLMFFSIISDSTHCQNHLCYSEIDMALDGGLGGVVDSLKAVPIYAGTVAEPLTAIRHGNGEDWWVFAMQTDGPGFTHGDTMLVFRAGPEGVVLEHQYATRKLWKQYELSASPKGDLLLRSATYIDASGDEKNAFITYRFDRCSGELTPSNVFDLNNWWSYGNTVSDNAMYVYAASRNDIGSASRIIRFDPTASAAVPEVLYAAPPSHFVLDVERGPGGAIYFIVCPRSTAAELPESQTLHRILNPEAPLSLVELDLNMLTLADAPMYTGGNSLPHFPYYTLGPDTAYCGGDTTTTDTTVAVLPPALESNQWRVYPTRTQGTFVLESAHWPAEATVLDPTGRLIERFPVTMRETRMDASRWPPGLYRIVLHHAGRFLGVNAVVRP